MTYAQKYPRQAAHTVVEREYYDETNAIRRAFQGRTGTDHHAEMRLKYNEAMARRDRKETAIGLLPVEVTPMGAEIWGTFPPNGIMAKAKP